MVLRQSDSPAKDACVIYLAGPIDSEYGPPSVRVLADFGTLQQEFVRAVREGSLMSVTSYRTNHRDGSIEETFPLLVNPQRIETINYSSKGDRRAAGWIEEGE